MDAELVLFISWLQANGRSERTIRAYTVALRDFAAWFTQATGRELSPKRITPLDVREYRQYLIAVRRLSPATVNNYLAGIRAYARWARQSGLTEQNPTNGIKSVCTTPTAPRWLTRQEQHALLRVVREEVQLGDLRARGNPAHPGAIWPRRDQALIVLLLNTGLRLSEVATLELGDVDTRERSGAVHVREGKGRKARTVPLNRDARTALQEWLEVRKRLGTETPALFVSQKGGGLGERAIGFRVAALACKAGLEGVSPHTLRHTFARNLVDAGVGLEKVGALLGHKSLEATHIYVTPSADLREATERVAWED